MAKQAPTSRTYKLKSAVTEMEMAMLRAIANSEFRDGNPDLTAPTWTAYVMEDVDLPEASRGGVLGSLVKKGLAGTTGTGREDTCWLTVEGIAALSGN